MDRASQAPTLPPAVARQRSVILVVLLGLAVAGWIVFLRQSRDTSGMGGGMGPDLTMGRSWPVFASTWVAMMVAMMFPAAAPMIVMYGRIRRSDPSSVALFTGAYIVLWFAFGAIAYLVSAAVETGAQESAWVATHWGRVGGGLLILAGIYQVTPLKDICLRHCRSPLAFVMGQWREGRVGAVRMGFHHGLYCMGCCWLLFLVLIPLGVMNVAAMAAVAVLVFVEKVVPWGRPAARAAGVLLIVAGAAVAFAPSLLPTVA